MRRNNKGSTEPLTGEESEDNISSVVASTAGSDGHESNPIFLRPSIRRQRSSENNVSKTPSNTEEKPCDWDTTLFLLRQKARQHKKSGREVQNDSALVGKPKAVRSSTSNSNSKDENPDYKGVESERPELAARAATTGSLPGTSKGRPHAVQFDNVRADTFASLPSLSHGEGGEPISSDSVKMKFRRIMNRMSSSNIFHSSNWKKGKSKSASDFASFSPLMETALAIPIFWVQRDEWGLKPPPIVFQFLKLRITESDINPNKRLHQDHFYFRIELEYGDVKWVIYRRMYDFVRLHTLLTFRHFQGRLPKIPTFPSQLSYAVDKVLDRVHGGGGRDERLRQIAYERRKAVEKYLLKLMRVLNLRVSFEFCAFLEASTVSLIRDLGWKGKEGYLDNRVKKTVGPCCTGVRPSRWRSDWIAIRDSCVIFCNSISDSSPKDILLCNKDFTIEHSADSKNPLRRRTITIGNKFRRIDLRASSEAHVHEWIKNLEQIQRNSLWVQRNRFDSFAPVRDNVNARWFVDGADYFYELSEALLNAKHTIYIGDWWLSPEMYLRRPPKENQEFRLDRLLLKKAEEGLAIYIVVYKEVTYALPISSQHTKETLKSLHPNIVVQRHPDHAPGGTMFWAKMCIIDSEVAFMGGLDLCFGRWDTHAHRLADYHKDPEDEIWPGQDYSNPRIKDFQDVQQFNVDIINRKKLARMPWHDIALCVYGSTARDIERHFIERWNFIKSSKATQKQNVPYLIPKGEYAIGRNENEKKGTCRIQVLRSSAEWSSGIERENSIYDAYVECISKAKHFIYIENQFFVTAATDTSGYTIKNRIGMALVERIIRAHKEQAKFKVVVIMPLLPGFENSIDASNATTIRLVMHWQFMSICRGKNSIFECLAAEGIEPSDYITFFGLRNYDYIRNPNYTGSDDKAEMDDEFNFDEMDENDPGAEFDHIFVEGTPADMHTHSHSSANKKPSENLPDDSGNSGSEMFDEKTAMNVQADEDTGPKKSHIQRMESSVAPDGLKIDTTQGRLNFEPSKQDNGPGSPDAQLSSPSNDHLTSPKSPSRLSVGSKNSISSKTSQTDEAPVSQTPAGSNVVTRHDKVPREGRFITELTYIHSKLMIIDDRIVLCGSANINDRSMLGNHDSEIALIIEDEEGVPSRMNGKEYLASRFAHSLRCSLFKEHLGLLPDMDMAELTRSVNEATSESNTSSVSEGKKPEINPDDIVKDPLCDDFFNDTWLKTARENTEIFRDAFRCVPDDTVTTWDEYKAFVPDPQIVKYGHLALKALPREAAWGLLSHIKGHLVQFPTQFLKEENLNAAVFSREFLVPVDVFI
ncbi:phospholipase D/nuclease [Basidiobolus meristosporus CBS 931.73]|uniref:Phospholipase n=1 Tax=Basidiobolus meristosporus CBS 931.73 TaxID=1314790 RepID=A0A1Y1Z5M8_9FUNG|nr:phospholipase D/nuclease [Basidiobolus meristosporus CBS 931.73]|eukprot:ORY05424.1 phospholipase D/nuclease [Basidiobolus meristosporus CBS 931.73]